MNRVEVELCDRSRISKQIKHRNMEMVKASIDVIGRRMDLTYETDQLPLLLSLAPTGW
jgi:hypothetical protein